MFSVGISKQHPQKSLNGPNCDRFLHSSSLIALVDGVNSVEREGINPVKFPVQLLHRCVSLVNERRLNPHNFDQFTKTLLSNMNVKMKDEQIDGSVSSNSSFIGRLICRAATETSELGSSTLCIALIEGTTLHVANVGDSGLCIFRLVPNGSHQDTGDDISDQWTYCSIWQTTPGLCRFNTPYQIMRMEEIQSNNDEIARAVAFGLTLDSLEIEVSRKKRDVALHLIFLFIQDGDVLIMGSDGLFDNVKISAIVDLLNSICRPTVIPSRGVSRIPLITPREIARQLVEVSPSINARSRNLKI